MGTMTQQRTTRQATPARWQQALTRALANGVEVRQLAGSGAWIATSASDPTAAYELAITGEIAHSCTCRAGEFGDPVCCHRARFYHLVGALDLDPEPSPLAAPAAPCRDCFGEGYIRASTGDRLSDWIAVPCRRCRGKEAPAIAA